MQHDLLGMRFGAVGIALFDDAMAHLPHLSDFERDAVLAFQERRQREQGGVAIDARSLGGKIRAGEHTCAKCFEVSGIRRGTELGKVAFQLLGFVRRDRMIDVQHRLGFEE